MAQKNCVRWGNLEVQFLKGNAERWGRHVTECFERTQEGHKTVYIKDTLKDITALS